MKKFALTITLVGLFVAAPASAGWEKAEWGMSPDQVESVQSETQHVKHGEKMGDKQVGSRGLTEFGGVKAKARYYYDAKGLTLVLLDIPIRQCRQVIEHIVADYGVPVTTSDQILFKLYIWHDDAKDTRLRLMLSPKSEICDLHFERLAEYRDHDLAH